MKQGILKISVTFPDTLETRWKEMAEAFLASQDVRGSSRAVYLRTSRQFFKWICETGREPSRLSRQDIIEYKSHLSECGLSPLTQNSYLISVRKFFEWTEGEKLYPNIARGVKGTRRRNAFEKCYLRDEESSRLLDYFKGATIERFAKGKIRFERQLHEGAAPLSSLFESISLRNYAIVNLMLRTGLRTVEISRLDICDLTTLYGRRVLKVWGKGKDSKDTAVNITEKALSPILEYLSRARKGARANAPLFVSLSNQNRGERLSTRTISSICKEGLRAIGKNGREFSAHSLRHTTGCALLEHGCNLSEVQRVLRHSNPGTTQIYTRLKEDELYLRNTPEKCLDEAF